MTDSTEVMKPEKETPKLTLRELLEAILVELEDVNAKLWDIESNTNRSPRSFGD